jgi:ribonuclease P protein component
MAFSTPGQALPPLKRLLSPAEFRHVLKRPKRSSDAYFTILARKGPSRTARIGLTVSKRAAKRAVDRNRIKRLVREVFRMEQELPNWDFVVVAKPSAKAATNPVLRASLERHFSRLKDGRD